MRLKFANLYGYYKDNYNDCIDMIRQTNLRHVAILNRWFLIVNIFFLVFSIMSIFGVRSSMTPFYAVFLGISVLFEVMMFVFRKSVQKYSLPIIYINMCIVMIYGILASVAQPYMAATFFIVLIVVIAISYIDTMARMTIALVVFTAAFLIASYTQKAMTIAFQDTYNSLLCLSLAVTLHFAFQRTRMQQFITHQKNVQIQRELEIKSSFDALTSLLNRGRFFAMAGSVLRGYHNEYMVLCLLDLDEFKQINDKLGHQMGDKAIQIAGNTITEVMEIDLKEKWSFQERAVRNGLSFAGRLGGDEFIVFIRGKSKKEEILTLMQEMLKKLNQVDYGELKGIHASIGITEILEQDMDIDDAYRRADEALYESKRAGKNQIHFSK
ncbi:MAG: GGDEF domain-containing protein [Lachnospiraceae bacterium]|nr:GGDEF domain-containing protein [Lachnospiraceae bacterium]